MTGLGLTTLLLLCAAWVWGIVRGVQSIKGENNDEK